MSQSKYNPIRFPAGRKDNVFNQSPGQPCVKVRYDSDPIPGEYDAVIEAAKQKLSKEGK